jgi:hypothetical protein
MRYSCPAPRRRSIHALSRWLAPALLASCGGGLYVGFELGGPDDRPPAVALTASVAAAPPGAVVQLAAAATDDFGVDHVDFLRRDPISGADTLLAADAAPPYQLDVTLPAGAAGSVVRYLARAVDGAGQLSLSAPVDITLR